jgi:hypothetical protein
MAYLLFIQEPYGWLLFPKINPMEEHNNEKDRDYCDRHAWFDVLYLPRYGIVGMYSVEEDYPDNHQDE